MLRQLLARALDGKQKRALKSKLNQLKQQAVRALRSYDVPALHAHLARIGIERTDTVLVHSNFDPQSGFSGTPNDLANALADYFGEQGNLLMVSIPFRGSAYDYLAQGKTFDVRKTISMMGLVTEMFRRRPGTLRSLHPTHPVLAAGKDAAWLTTGHEDCEYPCGPGSPFDKFRQLKGKILFFDVGFGAITFFHHVEHLIQGDLPIPVYEEQAFETPVVDAAGGRRTVRTYPFSRKYTRKAEALETEMAGRGQLHRSRVGNSRAILVSAEDVVDSMTAMVKAGRYPYVL